MKVIIEFTTAPPLVNWVHLLVRNGWKVIDHEPELAHLNRRLGQSEYPLRNATVWYIFLEERSETDASFRVTVTVPAFADGQFSRSRVYEEVEEIADQVGDAEPREPLTVDLLSEVRDMG